MKLATEFATLYHRAREEGTPQLIVQALPYARFLGMEAYFDAGALQFYLPPRNSNIGNPTLPALHGGAVAGFMEMAAAVHLLMHFDLEKADGSAPNVPKTIDFSIDYVRACRLEDTHCACDMVRQGRRVANLAIRVWQRDPAQPTATARAHYLLD